MADIVPETVVSSESELHIVLVEQTNVRALSLRWSSTQRLTHLPNEFERFTRLQVLKLIDFTDVVEMPTTMGQLTRMTYIEFNNMPALRRLPDFVGNWSELRCLKAIECQLHSLPDSMQELTKLDQLDLHGNRLEQLPNYVGKFDNLKILDVHSNQLTKMPKLARQSDYMTRVDIRRNPIRQLPRSWAILEIKTFEADLALKQQYEQLRALPNQNRTVWTENVANAYREFLILWRTNSLSPLQTLDLEGSRHDVMKRVV